MKLACAVLLLSLGMIYSWLRKKLTIVGVGTGGTIGLLIFIGDGLIGLVLLTLFFLLAAAASAYKAPAKRQSGLAEANSGRRNAGQVLANAGVAGLLAVWSWQFPAHASLAGLMLAGSLAAATADTLSSELGNVLGRRYYNILTLRPDQRGLNGVVSLEGTLCGIAGSTILAATYCLAAGFSPIFWWIIVAGTVGNWVDSVLGATLERQHYVSNDVVNFCNTLAGALAAGGLAIIAGR